MEMTSGLILAIAYVAAPGPITVETLRYGIKGGFIHSLAVQTGSALGIIVYAGLALYGARLTPQDSFWQLAVGVTGTVLLIYLGISTIRGGGVMDVRPGKPGPAKTSPQRAFWSGAVLSLANPLDLIFWLSIGSRVQSDPGQGGAGFLSGFVVGCLLASAGVALIAAFFQARLTCRAALVVSWACGLAMVGFGLRLGFSLVQNFIV